MASDIRPKASRIEREVAKQLERKDHKEIKNLDRRNSQHVVRVVVDEVRESMSDMKSKFYLVKHISFIIRF